MDLADSRNSFLDLSRGLFLIKYDSARAPANPPRLVISPEGWAPADLEIILPPDEDEPVLWSPGGCLVVRACRPGRLMVTIVPKEPHGSTVANIQLVPLSEDPLGLRSTGELNFSEIKFLGHLSGVGDVRVAGNEWLGGPDAPRRIEGIAIEMPDLPSSVRLRYSVRTGGARPTTMPIVDAGAFAGTRGRALPLVGVMLEISGSGASRYTIALDGLFLGSPIKRMSGQRVVLAGPTGQEPLVGLLISIVEAHRASAEPTTAGKVSKPEAAVKSKVRAIDRLAGEGSYAKPGGRVSVFRSRPAVTNSDNDERVVKGDTKSTAPAVSKSKVRVFNRGRHKANRE